MTRAALGLLVCVWWALLVGLTVLYMRPPTTRPTISPVEHPRCFPENTVVPRGFVLCPDTLPTQRST